MSEDKDKKEAKMMFCCGDSEDMCRGYSCDFEETEKGYTITVTSDDPEKVEKLKAKIKSCCGPEGGKSCC